VDEHTIKVNGQTIKIFNEMKPADIKWGSVGAKVVAESSGAFLTQEKAGGHLKGGADTVILSAPAKDVTPTYVYGVNHLKYKSTEKVISNASCTTNCLAPLAYIVHKNYGIVEGLMTTVHSATAS